eukprot:CAMPEP_0204834192 /NCGR_PEP_ID=MMETSP1346-20131115/19088_1 /ASSEMBLY_ACC=CAM_ASM_000771 /TAXON_ID=215587 /ORGANISM="Aplanochytrium stocchinoi, Strain GSBS06" /LENGTH=91 /DNA_ID=CAMNT_0051967319 /DNA_START=162 /DNA_END=433 /DNA_ORIENTATION=-
MKKTELGDKNESRRVSGARNELTDTKMLTTDTNKMQLLVLGSGQKLEESEDKSLVSKRNSTVQSNLDVLQETKDDKSEVKDNGSKIGNINR